MNEHQSEILELLKVFISVTKELNLRYYLVCGSALGAAKYKGFIPWDDDIDVGMPREDYDVFLQKAQQLLPEHLFLQNYKTDKRFPHVFSKLRNSNTTLIEKSIAHLNMNHGIYMDIFPIDGYPNDDLAVKKLYRKKKALCRKHYCALKSNDNWKVIVRNFAYRCLGYHKRTHIALAKMEELITRYPTYNSEKWCNYGNWQGVLEYAPKWHYGQGTQAEFEGVKVIIPEKYDEYLTQKYGDWRKDPPKNKQKSHHNIKVLDTKKSYIEYI